MTEAFEETSRDPANAEVARETKTVRPGRRRRASLTRRLVSADARSLGLLRWALGALLIADLVGRMGVVDTLYSNDGVLSNHYSLFRPLAPYQFSLYASFSSSRDVMVAFVLTLVVYVCFTIGYRTRLFHLLSFICVTSLHARNLLAELPADVPLHLLTAWTLFLPLGRRFSVDAVRRSLAVDPNGSVASLNERAPLDTRVASFAVLAVLLQGAVIHIASTLRQSGATWQDGSALYYALRQNLWVTDVGSWVGRRLPIEELRTLSFGYRGASIAIGVLMLVPALAARRTALAVLALFHLSSRLLWNFGLYEWVMLAFAPMLVSTDDWEKAHNWYAKHRPAFVVYVDPACGISRWAARRLARLGGVVKLTFVERASTAMATHRAAISEWFGLRGFHDEPQSTPARTIADTPWRALLPAAIRTRETAAVLLAVACAWALVRDVGDDTPTTETASIAYRAIAYPRLFQRWGLFAPDPPMRPGTIVAEAQTAGGARLDPFTGLPIAASSSPETTARPRPHPLMSAYFTSISQPSRSTYVNELREYVRRTGERRGPADKLVWFNVDWIESPIVAPDSREASIASLGPAVPRRITSGP